MRLETAGIKRVISVDGTSIGYQSVGEGPGVILVQGAMGTARNYHQLALSMANRFTVYLPDRRGRAMSPRAYQARHSIQQDVEDLGSLMTQTRARYLFGLSSGAMIVLEALRTGPPVERAAIYELPFYRDGMATDFILRFNAQIERNQLAGALVTATLIVGLGPKPLALLPQWLLRLGAAIALRANDRRLTPYAPLRELIPAMQYDFNVLAAMNLRLSHLEAVKTPVLLMGGDKSPTYLKSALTVLRTKLPNAEFVGLAGADHSAPWNDDLRGNA